MGGLSEDCAGAYRKKGSAVENDEAGYGQLRSLCEELFDLFT